MILTVLAYIGIGILVFIGIFTLFFLIFVFMLIHYAQKFIWNMPIMKWVNLEDTVALGVPKFICMGLLVALYEKKHLEVRPKEGLSERQSIIVEKRGFVSRTIRFHEFRMTVGPRRKKEKFDAASFLKKFFPDFEPAGTLA